MTLRPIQRTMFAGAVMAAFTFTAHAQKQQQTTNPAQGQHEGMNHKNMDMKNMDMKGMADKIVVDAPDYAAANEPVKQQLAQLLNSYLKLKDALVATDPQVAKTEAQAVLTAAGKVDVAGLTAEQQQFATEKLEKVKQSASEIAGVADIAAQRENLEPLSEATFSLTKAFGATDQKLYYQRCPMANNSKGGYWLSSNQEIHNPYFGKQMLKCGSTEEVLN